MYSLKEGTVVWDTATEAYELARLAHFGQLSQIPPQKYTEVNNEWRELLRFAYDSPMNTVFIHKMRPVWLASTDSQGRTKSVKTNEFELSGFSEMDYLSQVNLVHYYEEGDDGPLFSIYVKTCRHNPEVGGQVLSGPMCNFDFLLALIHG